MADLESPVLSRKGEGEHDPRPVVRRSPAGLPGAAIALIAALLAIALFLVLDGRRRHAQPGMPKLPETAFLAPPPLSIPEEKPEQPQTSPAIVAMPLPSPPPPILHPQGMPPISMPLSPMTMMGSPQGTVGGASGGTAEPALVVDNGTGSGPAGLPGVTAGGAQAGQGGGVQGEDAPIRTTIIRNRSTIMPVGTVIPAVLETPIDSTRAGLVRAVVSEDTRGFDGRRVLVPRGSRLIGEYQSDIRSGQNRVLVTWTRLLRPDGVAIRIASPGADALGGAGLPGHVNTFFFRRFAGAVLQSALTVGVNLASRPGNGSVIVGAPASGISSVGQDLLPSTDLKPRVKIKQGAVFTVFVARDLDFSGTPDRSADLAN